MNQPRYELSFAAADKSAIPISSTWTVRGTPRPEFFVMNRDVGGETAHASFHKDGRCHIKLKRGAGSAEKVKDWRLPRPMDGSVLRRMTDIVIPHSGLGPHPRTVATLPGLHLVDAPGHGQELVVTLFIEPPGALDNWPGKRAMNSRLVGRFGWHLHDTLTGFLTAVACYFPERPSIPDMLREAQDSLPQRAMAFRHRRLLHVEFSQEEDGTFPIFYELQLG